MDSRPVPAPSAQEQPTVPAQRPVPAAPPTPLGIVFISHSSHDAQIAMQIVSALERAGVPCWVAPRDITAGSDYNDSIMTGINNCREN